MPRGPRLDTRGALHHVMVRGLDRQVIFRTDEDRRDFLERLGNACEATGLRVLAWALLPNHAHLLIRTGVRPLSMAMRILLAGYAGAFNRRHKHIGHLFQNRYKSILVEEEPYTLLLVQYIHLNPIRAGVAKGMTGLDRYQWTGHYALLGRAAYPWQATEEVLGRFAEAKRTARHRYHQFIAAGLTQGRRPELQGGGLRRSVYGWQGVAALRRGREAWAADERVLGGSEFVERVLATVAESSVPSKALAEKAFPGLLRRCAAAWGLSPTELAGGGRRRAVARARMAASYLAVQHLGMPIARVAELVGISPTVVREGGARGERLLQERGLTPEALLPGEWKYP
jgi:putative transposase